MQSSRQLSIPRSGTSTRLLYSEIADRAKLTTFAAWQTPEKGTPKRVVIRLDGEASGDGYPCAVATVRYSIGGLTREVDVDCAGQSALVVWADSVDVTAKWDTRRIARIAAYSEGGVQPASWQSLAASISAGADAGDQGAADARYLDVIRPDIEIPQEGGFLSLHPIPFGARGLRFLDGYASGAVISTPELASFIAFTAQPLIAGTLPSAPQNGVIEYVTNGATDTSLIIVPSCAKQLWFMYAFPNAISDLAAPAFIEWILSPNSVPNGY